MLDEKKGYRCESYGGSGEWKAKKVIIFEVEDLGNLGVLEESCEALNIKKKKCTLDVLIETIEKQFGPDAGVIWLGTKEDVKERYCEENEDPIEFDIPEGAVVLSDLDEEGALFLLRGL